MIVKIEQWLLNTLTGALYLEKDETQENAIILDHTPLELLLCLIRYQGSDVTKNVMLEEVWPKKVVSEDVLSVGISQIRKALGDNARKPTFIKTIPGIGYKLICSAVEISITQDDQNSAHSLTQISKQKVSQKAVLVIVVTIILSLLLIIWQLKNSQPKAIYSSEQLPSQAIIDLYQKGRYLLSSDQEDKWKEAQQAFEDTIIHAPNFSPVYRELVEVKIKINHNNKVALYHKLDELYFLLNKSLEINPNDPETLKQLANVAFWIEWNFPKAEKYYLQGIEMAPEHAELHFLYAQFQLAKHNFDLAMKHTKRYVDLYPKSYAVPSVAWVYNMMEDYDKALIELKKVEEIDPNGYGFHVSSQAILENMGEDEKAYQAFYQVLSQSKYTPEQLADVASAYQAGGLQQVYHWLLTVKKETGWIGQYYPPLSFARYAIKAGKLDEAADYIVQATAQRQTEMLWFFIDPKYKALRNHPKVANIININGENPLFSN